MNIQGVRCPLPLKMITQRAELSTLKVIKRPLARTLAPAHGPAFLFSEKHGACSIKAPKENTGPQGFRHIVNHISTLPHKKKKKKTQQHPNMGPQGIQELSRGRTALEPDFPG